MPARGEDFTKGYVPSRGDVVHLDWNPAVGHEMKGPHYGLVLSQNAYNIGTGLVVVSPIASKVGKLSAFEFEVRVGRVDGVAVLSQFRTLDFQTRSIQYEGAMSTEQIDEAARRVRMIL
ncbi:putative plasmid maintenance toxin (MazE-like) [Magnetospirillum sp. LM-5]|uniref:type II toxin-antitoxin system PemK/MazF family toxin n=1 Tax=Magnetospirillum sp. LM-5 TaxID=2681466 RepID=UPI0013864ACF|nr:type II toxin-antitoxin system PemK/MazF family toxin [Magnetospirillum sp. LM-5]CAA7615648.1 putative plasmid maintenance toxin (MazE-like) [Magnetospirillum sp. LM-5]